MQTLRHYIRTHLQQDLSLTRLAAVAGVSKFKLHRHFAQSVGLTPAQYVEQSRLQSAALALAVSQSRVLDVAMQVGYNNHETFCRAFRRVFKCSPQSFRHAHQAGNNVMQPWRGHGLPDYALSAPRLVRMRPLQIATLRFVGNYHNVPDQLWLKLTRSLRDQQIAWRGLMGIGYDDPAHSGVERCRFDAAAIVTTAAQSVSGVKLRQLHAQSCVVVTHVGGYQTLPAALPGIYALAAEQPEYEVVGLPLLELYHTRIVAADEFSYTDICVPVRPVSAQVR